MASARELLMDIIIKPEPTVEKQYGGGLDDAYMTLSQRRDSAFADPNANSAFASPMSMGGLPTIYREDGGTTVPKERMINNQPHQLSYINSQEAGLLKALGGSGRKVDGIPSYFWSGDESGYATGGEEGFADTDTYSEDGTYTQSQLDALSDVETKASPSLASLVDEGIIDYDEAYNPQGIQQAMLEAERADRAEARGEYQNWYSGRGAPSLDPRSVRSLSERDKATVQSLIDRDKMQGLGIPLANMLERQYNLKTFEKGLRGPLEVYSQGSAKGRDDPTGGFVDDPEDVKRLALEFGYAKPGETMKDFAIRFEEETGRVAPLEYFGFDRNSARDMNKNVQDVNAAMQANNLRGIGQGLGLIAGLNNPLTGMNAFTRGYTGERDSEGRPVTSTALGSVYDRVTGGLSDLVDKGKEAIFGPGESDFSKAERAAYAEKGISEKEYIDAVQFAKDNNIPPSDFANMTINGKQQPTLEEVNKVNMSRSGVTLTDVLRATDNPLGFALDRIASGRPTTDADIARERNQEAMTTKDLSREGLLELVGKPSSEKIDVSTEDRRLAAQAEEIDRRNNRPVMGPKGIRLLKGKTEDQEKAQQRVNQADRINAIIDLNIKEEFDKISEKIKTMPFISDDERKAPKQESKSFGQQIIDFLSSAGSPAIPDESTNLGSNDTVERKRVAQPTQKQVAAIAKEAAKIPEEVQKTITSAGLLPQYLALIRAGYTAERAIKAIGLPAGTAIA